MGLPQAPQVGDSVRRSTGKRFFLWQWGQATII
jgi:hypothetical protein